MGNTKITKKQKQVLDFIKSYKNKNGYSPSLEEIQRKFKLASVSTAHYYIKKLQGLGYLQKKKHLSRAIDIYTTSQTTQIPLLGIITAGKPIEAVRNPEPIDVPKSMLSRAGRHYALKVKGDSMVDEGIFDGDTVIVREQSVVNNGESAVAYLPDTDEATLKKIYKEKNRIRLQPANPKLKPFYETNVEIQGKVVSILRKVK